MQYVELLVTSVKYTNGLWLTSYQLPSPKFGQSLPSYAPEPSSSWYVFHEIPAASSMLERWALEVLWGGLGSLEIPKFVPASSQR